MHVIHDVPLDVVGERLAASGVRPELRDEALAAIRAKLKRSGLGERAFDDEQELQAVAGSRRDRAGRVAGGQCLTCGCQLAEGLTICCCLCD